MTRYQLRPHTVICSLCSDEIYPGNLFEVDDRPGAKYATACIPCVEERDEYYAEQDGDFQRKFAMEA